MNVRSLVYRDSSPRRAFALLFLCLWVILVAILARNHVVWRDEVRAYSFALQGHNLLAMLKGIHGEGHPAIWYLLLRAGHTLFPQPQILQIVAYLVAFAALLLLVLRSPFNLLTLALLLFSRFALYEYSVMARNYGISMLLLFLIAALYPRHRNRGLLIGALLFLLANTNSHSVLLVGAFLVFWLVDLLLSSNPASRPQALRNYLLNAACAVAGIVVCAITVLPSINDDGAASHPHGIALLLHILKALLEPAEYFSNVLAFNVFNLLLGHFKLLHQPYLRIFKAVMSLLLFASTLGLVRRPAALIASWVALFAFLLFFAVLYPGFYRHEALWLIFLIALYWIAGQPTAQPAPAAASPAPVIRAIQSSGYAAFLLVLVLQVIAAALSIFYLTYVGPAGRGRDLGHLVSQNPALSNAIILADPDYLVETVPYYLSNPTYLIREHRFGNIVHFTHNATHNLSLDDILNQAQQLHAGTGQPVIILMLDHLDPSAPPHTHQEAYAWNLATTPEQVRRFLASTHLIQRFGCVSDNDETYAVYQLN
jgi:hypothetical protein